MEIVIQRPLTADRMALSLAVSVLNAFTPNYMPFECLNKNIEPLRSCNPFRTSRTLH